MQISFRTNKLERCYTDSQQAIRTWGEDVAKKYIQRINLIKECANLQEVLRLPGFHGHPLKGKLAGKYAITIKDRHRLILKPIGKELQVVLIEEVNIHYGD